jgi:hypothetical protein
MKSWEEMKDFSYVGIKLTKAKTISEGLTKCKIQKLTRQNPVYEHLKLHQLIQGRKKCQLCTSITASLKPTASHSQPLLKMRPTTAPLLDASSTLPLHQQKHQSY